MYYDSGNEPVEALGRFARRVGSGGALYIGGGIGIEKVSTKNGDRYQLTRADSKNGETFSGPLSAVMRAFSTAGQSTSADSPGGTSKISDPAAAARLHELRDMERQSRKEIERLQARIAAKAPVAAGGIPTPNAVNDESYEVRRLAETKRELAQIQAEREALINSGKVEEVEQVRPGTNFTKIPPQNVKKLSGIIQHYKGMAHPFSTCVRDQIKHGLSEDHANRRCAVVKDLAMGTTKWRKGGKVKEEEAVELAERRVATIEEALGAGAAYELAEMPRTGNNVVDAMAEGTFADLTVLALAEHPVGRLWEAELIERAFSTKKRKDLAKTGAAMSDGSYPIENGKDLDNARRAIGRAPAGKRDAVKAHIRKRAKALKINVSEAAIEEGAAARAPFFLS